MVASNSFVGVPLIFNTSDQTTMCFVFLFKGEVVQSYKTLLKYRFTFNLQYIFSHNNLLTVPF